MMLAKRCFLLAHALSSAHVPASKSPCLQRNFETTPRFEPKTPKMYVDCQTMEYDDTLGVREFPGMQKGFSRHGSLIPSPWTLHDHSNLFYLVFTYQKSFTLGPTDPAGVPAKIRKIVCDISEVSGGNSVLPIFQKT